MATKKTSQQLIQIKVDNNLKKDLDNIAHYKGITVSALVKLNLTEIVRIEKKHIFTENGLTEDQEFEILSREKEIIEDYRQGKIRARSGKSILKELNA
ncbi:type II toxin-antitoxin system RelB/DinJ family antitoxin [Candidatus Peregrinibacteria bacterium]|nr:type II toxin-antitoxin system RelB/DinJ family antitoxin [Candidatus Peregrinibacteria bacterium]